jgi:hypothetical protein
MGSQQLLLIVICVVLAGVGVAVGIWLFIDQSAATNRDEISNDLVQFGASAQKYYRRPATLGGGNNSFGGLTMTRVTSKPTNPNGTYVLTPDPVPASAASVTITGIGIEMGVNGSSPVQMTMTVSADSLLIVTDN